MVRKSYLTYSTGFSDEVKTGKWYIDKPINFMEKLSVKLANLVIICEKGRLQQMAVIPNQYIIVPNIPEGIDDLAFRRKSALIIMMIIFL